MRLQAPACPRTPVRVLPSACAAAAGRSVSVRGAELNGTERGSVCRRRRRAWPPSLVSAVREAERRGAARLRGSTPSSVSITCEAVAEVKGGPAGCSTAAAGQHFPSALTCNGASDTGAVGGLRAVELLPCRGSPLETRTELAPAHRVCCQFKFRWDEPGMYFLPHSPRCLHIWMREKAVIAP